MPYPEQPVENIQDVIKEWFNREIRDYFNDLNVDDNWDPDLTVPRQKLAATVRHQDDDSLLLTMLKAWFFEYIKSQTYRVPYYGIPVSSFNESRRFRPQITLFFQEDWADVDPDWTPIRGEISFRLMNHTYETLTQNIAQQFATRINSNFALAGGRIWRRGKSMATYNDWGKGYAFKILSRNSTDARTLIEAVLDVQNDTPNWSKMNYSENEEPAEAYPTLPPNDYIYGNTRRLPRRRPIAEVRFMSAFLHIYGLPNPIVLVDRTGNHRTALISA